MSLNGQINGHYLKPHREKERRASELNLASGLSPAMLLFLKRWISAAVSTDCGWMLIMLCLKGDANSFLCLFLM